MKSKFLSIDNIFEEVRDRVVWIKFKHFNMPEDKPNLISLFKSGKNENSCLILCVLTPE